MSSYLHYLLPPLVSSGSGIIIITIITIIIYDLFSI